MDAPLELASISGQNAQAVTPLRRFFEVCPRRRWYHGARRRSPAFYRRFWPPRRPRQSRHVVRGGSQRRGSREDFKASELCAALWLLCSLLLSSPPKFAIADRGRATSSASSRLSSSLFSRRTARRSPDGVHLQQRLRLGPPLHRLRGRRERRVRHGVARGRARVGRAVRDQARRARRAVPEPRAVDDAAALARERRAAAQLVLDERGRLHVAPPRDGLHAVHAALAAGADPAAAARLPAAAPQDPDVAAAPGAPVHPRRRHRPPRPEARQRALRPAHAQAAALRLRLLEAPRLGQAEHLLHLRALLPRARAPPRRHRVLGRRRHVVVRMHRLRDAAGLPALRQRGVDLPAAARGAARFGAIGACGWRNSAQLSDGTAALYRCSR